MWFEVLYCLVVVVIFNEVGVVVFERNMMVLRSVGLVINCVDKGLWVI